MTLVETGRIHAEVLDPSWRRWVTLVELAVAESQHSAWSDAAHILEQRAPDAPLLHLATLRVEPGRAAAFVKRLVGELGVVARERVEPLALILAGVERDGGTLDVLAGKLAVSNDAVAVLAQLSALPLLLNVARASGAESSRTWQRGYCPVCGAWPAMVEMRGIQRERWLRCGCCGSDWVLPVLRCAFCDETDHQKLGLLLSEGNEQQIRIETCSTCHGYLKSMTTLAALPFVALATKDASTVAFDLAAQDRGYARPTRPGWQLHVEIVQ
ncbi:MAG TPA: formate dehydrogenase accessory protein FdhE [Gemmatimonadaceae bacterium]